MTRLEQTPTLMLGIALATVRDRWLSLAGAFAALTVGAALAIGAGAVLAAADSAVGDEPGRYAAAPIIVTAPLGAAEELVPAPRRRRVPRWPRGSRRSRRCAAWSATVP